MRIGDVAGQLGITSKALRFYEGRGLPPRPARELNGYGEFGADDLQRLRVLLGLRRLDVPLEEDAELANLCADGHCDRVAGGVRAAIARRREQIARRASEMTSLDDDPARLDIALAPERRRSR